MGTKIDRSNNTNSFIKVKKNGTLNIGRLSPEDREEFKKILAELAVEFKKTVVETDQHVVIPQVTAIVQSITEKAAAEICHRQSLEHDGLNHELSSLKVTLNDLREQCNKVFAKVVQNFDGVQNSLAALQELNDRLQLDTRKTLVCCEEILMQIRWGNEHIKELSTLVKKNSKGIAKIGDKVEAIDDKFETLKEIVLSFLQTAEIQHEEYQSARTVMEQRYKELSSPSPGLYAQTIADMHEWLQELSGKSVEEIEKSIDEKSSELSQKYNEADEKLNAIKKLVADYGEAQKEGQKKLEEQLSLKAGEILQREAELYGLALDTNATVHDTNAKVDDIAATLYMILEEIRKSSWPDSRKAESTEQVQRLMDENADRVANLQVQIFELAEKLKIEKSSGADRDERACPWCGYYDNRKIIGDECVCGICGHRFPVKDVDPNMRYRWFTPEQEQEMISRWKENHTAVLEKVSENKYRMKIPSRAVGDDKILIIPSEFTYPQDAEDKTITRIDFCQPNTDDEEGRKQLLNVKKLFLEGGIKIGEFHDVVPFSEIKGLEKVMTMKWDVKGFKEAADNTLEKIKGRVANDA